MPTGRYAPSPSGDLHVGNLRTALLAMLFAHSDGSELRLRIDDLDPFATDPRHATAQLDDLAAIGVEFDGEVLHQSQRFEMYHEAIADLEAREITYPCFCSRREIREAASAPHVHLPHGAYPGTCRDLGAVERSRRAESRPAALRVRADAEVVSYADGVYGPIEIEVDDFVIRRNDGVPSYNLATVIDDAAQSVGEVVRGADLLEGSGRQIWLRRILGIAPVRHAHVPLIVDGNGERLAKRDDAVTMGDLARLGWAAVDVRNMLLASVGLSGPGESPTNQQLVERFDPEQMPREPTVWVYPGQKTTSENV